MEKYNKYHESLYIDCGCGKPPKKDKCGCNPKDPCGCGGEHLPSNDNELEILVRQLRKEVNKLLKTTQAQLLCQNKKIDETMVYIKNNLSNALRVLLESMLESGQLEDLITGIVSNEIELLQADIEKLNIDVTQLKAQTTTNTSDITNLKGQKLDFQSYSDDNINSKFLNVDVTTDYANDSIIYITKINNLNKLAVLPTNNDVTKDVYEDRTNVIDYANTNDNYDVYANAGMSGIYIFDGIVNTTTRLDCPYYCGFTASNEMKFYNGLTSDITAQDLLDDGIVNCFSGFAPIIENYQVKSYSDLEALYDTNDIAKAFIDSLDVKHPRQLIAQDSDNNFYIYSIMGRFNNSKGFNYPEMKSYFLAKGYKNVFNCDGGGSMQTIYNKNHVFYPSQELDTNADRIVPSVIGFSVKEAN